MNILKKFLYFLSPQEKKRAILLICMSMLIAIFEMIGVFSILPFMAVLSNPEVIDTNFFLNSIFKSSSKLGVYSKQQFLFILGIIVFLLLVLSLTLKAITTFLQIRFNTNCEYNIARRLVEGYLHQPYIWFLNRNSADLGKTLLSEVGTVVSKGLAPAMNLITQIFLILSIITLLLIIHPVLTLIISSILSLTYGLIYKFTRSIVNQAGQERLSALRWLFTAVSEAFGAVKEVKVGGLEKVYTNRFSIYSKTMAKNNALIGMISQLPRYLIEIIVFGGMLLIILSLMGQNGNFTNVIPIVSLFAYSGYRLMPALQQLYLSITSLRYSRSSINSLFEDFKNLRIYTPAQSTEHLQFKKKITLKNIYYKYPNTNGYTLKNLNITIPIGSSIGIMGSTGCGKTTTVDIILGLLEAQRGDIEIDGKILTKYNQRAWQRSVGYVPQHIFLADDTVAANIAFGIDPKNIDKKAIENAAKIANLHEFVINELPKQYETVIGERGVRLSGGQRQRIGLARALYLKPRILVLDEATSALDNITEQKVMNEINQLQKNITIIIIAHRLSTLRECDSIILMDKGEIKKKGTYDELIVNNN